MLVVRYSRSTTEKTINRGSPRIRVFSLLYTLSLSLLRDKVQAS
jgi:hypothetical protein